MSTDKTLADVQPGGRVRLGDALPESVAQALATVNEVANDARHAGNYKVANTLVTARVILSKHLLALSAQPSPSGQDAHSPLSVYADSYRRMAKIGDGRVLCTDVAFDIEHNMSRALAARQPVDSCTESECKRCRTHPDHRGSMEHAGISDFRQPVAVPLASPGNGEWSDGWNSCREATLRGDVSPVDDARQPVGEPVAVRVTPEMRAAFRKAYREGGFWHDRLDTALNAMMRAAPPAQAVDLAPDHRGMRVDYHGLLGRSQEALRQRPELAEMLRQLHGHLTEMGKRWYASDRNVVDEFLQLYAIEDGARRSLIDNKAVRK